MDNENVNVNASTNEKKSPLKFFILGVIVLIIVLVVAYLMFKKPGNLAQNPEEVTTASLANPAMANINVPTPATASSENGLVGTWVSAVAGKGMQGSGKVVTANSSTNITTSGDLKIIIQKVENNVAIGTMEYTNLCYVAVITLNNRSPITRAPRCTNTGSQPARIQVAGDKLSYDGKTSTSANVAFEGTYKDGTLTGTFIRTGSYGKITGTLNLVRSK